MTDFYQIIPESDVLKRVRRFMEERVQPIINDYWIRDEFPFELIPEFKKLGLPQEFGLGEVLMEMARVDPSIATFLLVHYGLGLASLRKCGNIKQQLNWQDSLLNFEKIYCFALTEPDTGSGISKDLVTRCKKTLYGWVLNGQKKWAGNAVFADIVIIWARDMDDNQIKGFIVPTDSTGFKVEKIENKFGLKIVQNGLITLKDVLIQEDNHLEGNYKDILRSSRALVGWIATGVQMGAYELALKYTKERKQFGKPIASFQLIQDLLAKILGNLTACQCMMLQLSKIDFNIAQASLAKAFTSLRMRESVAWAREIFGGNGISIDYNIGGFFCDAEAIYTYEGSYQINNLIVGKHITGLSAFA